MLYPEASEFIKTNQAVTLEELSLDAKKRLPKSIRVQPLMKPFVLMDFGKALITFLPEMKKFIYS